MSNNGIYPIVMELSVFDDDDDNNNNNNNKNDNDGDDDYDDDDDDDNDNMLPHCQPRNKPLVSIHPSGEVVVVL